MQLFLILMLFEFFNRLDNIARSCQCRGHDDYDGPDDYDEGPDEEELDRRFAARMAQRRRIADNRARYGEFWDD